MLIMIFHKFFGCSSNKDINFYQKPNFHNQIIAIKKLLWMLAASHKMQYTF
jgi:hypothetical protein